MDGSFPAARAASASLSKSPWPSNVAPLARAATRPVVKPLWSSCARSETIRSPAATLWATRNAIAAARQRIVGPEDRPLLASAILEGDEPGMSRGFRRRDRRGGIENSPVEVEHPVRNEGTEGADEADAEISRRQPAEHLRGFLFGDAALADHRFDLGNFERPPERFLAPADRQKAGQQPGALHREDRCARLGAVRQTDGDRCPRGKAEIGEEGGEPFDDVLRVGISPTLSGGDRSRPPIRLVREGKPSGLTSAIAARRADRRTLSQTKGLICPVDSVSVARASAIMRTPGREKMVSRTSIMT